MANDYGTCNRDYFIQQYPDLADVFSPKTKSQQTLAQPTPRKPRRTVAPLPLRKPERAGEVAVLYLPLPPPELQTNIKHKINPYKVTKLIKATRSASAFIASQIRPPEPWTAARVDVKCYGVGRIDRDGVIGWLKNQIDGLQDAGLIDDDNGIEWGTIERFTAKQSEGRKEVELVITNLSHVA
jgi:Holliday junction resolvase RusA-like endonuclease